MVGTSKASRSSNKARGTLYEHRFIVQCLERGLAPFIPIESGSAQDLLVMNRDSTVFRVQVKGTSVPVQKGKGVVRYKISASTGQYVKQVIDCQKVDIVAAYIDPLDSWYIIPCDEVNVTSVWISPSSQTSRFEKYKDYWELFAN